jgi:hypothetical protein
MTSSRRIGVFDYMVRAFDSFRIWTHVYRYGFNEISDKRIFRIPNNEHR